MAALKLLTDGGMPAAPMWPNRAGGPKFYRAARSALKAASSAVKRAQRAAAFDPAGFHALRRTAATLSLQAGMSLRDGQAMLGHASPHMTMTRYALPDIDAQRAGTSRVADERIG